MLVLLSGCATPPSPATWTNSLGMRFVRVPAGAFTMGREEPAEALAARHPDLPPARFDELGDELPAHRVRITRDFWLGQHEVTVGQFRRFVERSGYRAESEADGSGGYGWQPGHGDQPGAQGDAFAGRSPRWSWRDPGFAQDEDHPVVNVSWHDAQAMARWLSAHEGRRYRLPTEAEWEYACRGGPGQAPADDPRALPRIANTFDAAAAPFWPRFAAHALAASDGHAFTAPVGRYAPNALGLHDMLGNVWEWVRDRYDEGYYAASPADDPPGPAEGALRVRRGGSWHTWALYARCNYRNINTPQTRYPLLGMRLVVEKGER